MCQSPPHIVVDDAIERSRVGHVNVVNLINVRVLKGDYNSTILRAARRRRLAYVVSHNSCCIMCIQTIKLFFLVPRHVWPKTFKMPHWISQKSVIAINIVNAPQLSVGGYAWLEIGFLHGQQLA
jgi:hypothetical protein